MPRSPECCVQPGKVLSQIADCAMAVSAWILAWLAMVCLLSSLGLQTHTRAYPHHQVAHRSSAKSRELVVSLSSILPTTSTKFICSRASAHFFSPVLFLSADEEGPVAPPMLDYRPPPGSVWALGQDVSLLVTPAALSNGETRTFFRNCGNFLTSTAANLKTRVL